MLALTAVLLAVAAREVPEPLPRPMMTLDLRDQLQVRDAAHNLKAFVPADAPLIRCLTLPARSIDRLKPIASFRKRTNGPQSRSSTLSSIMRSKSKPWLEKLSEDV